MNHKHLKKVKIVVQLLNENVNSIKVHLHLSQLQNSFQNLQLNEFELNNIYLIDNIFFFLFYLRDCGFYVLLLILHLVFSFIFFLQDVKKRGKFSTRFLFHTSNQSDGGCIAATNIHTKPGSST